MNNDLYVEMKRMIKQIISEENIALIKVATVVSFSAPNVVVKLEGTTTNITIPNKSGLSFVANDRVVCVILNGDLSNMFVGWKV